MFDPVEKRFYFYNNNRFVLNYNGFRYHATEFNNGRPYLCGCMPAMMIDGQVKFPAWRYKNKSKLDIIHKQVVFAERMDQYYEKS